MSRRSQLIFLLAFPLLACIALAILVSTLWLDRGYSPRDILSQKFSGDVLGVVADAPLKAQASYDVTLEESFEDATTLLSTLALEIEGPFQGNVQVLTPLDVEIISRDFKKEENFQNLHAFQGRVSLKEKMKKTFKFRYRREAKATPYLLSLLPHADTLKYQVAVHAPDYLSLESKTMNVQGTKATYAGSSKQPVLLRVDSRLSEAPLTLLSAKFKNTSEISLEFNLSLDSKSASDGLNFSLQDMNEKNTEVTDRVFVERAVADERQISLKLRGVTLQRGERYELALKDINGKNGKTLAGNFFSIGVVQPQNL